MIYLLIFGPFLVALLLVVWGMCAAASEANRMADQALERRTARMEYDARQLGYLCDMQRGEDETEEPPTLYPNQNQMIAGRLCRLRSHRSELSSNPRRRR